MPRYISSKFKIIGILISMFFLSGCEKMIVLNSKGSIGQEEADLIYTAFGLMLIVVIPVFIMAFWFAMRYRASKKNEDYDPNWGNSSIIEKFIWLVPILIVAILSYLVWTKTHKLDPYKSIASEKRPLNIEVISLDWNWLFIYPDYDIAILNELVIPAKTPVSFKLTSASLMTSFFIPQLGSQMYAMAGMRTRLHLLANYHGEYEGQNFEFNGDGYTTMHFKVYAKTPQAFNDWMKQTKATSQKNPLTMESFKILTKPLTNRPIVIYTPVEKELFNKVMEPYRGWMDKNPNMHTNDAQKKSLTKDR
jgi:cytochrome o ubiquinol oxidase subunit II